MGMFQHFGATRLFCTFSTLLSACSHNVSMDGGRYSIDPDVTPMILTLNSSWYREFAMSMNDTEPCAITEDTDVVVFTVFEPWSGHSPLSVALWQSWTSIFRWLNFSVVSITPRQTMEPKCGGKLKDLGVKVFVMPGGDTQLYASFTESRDNIQRFIQDGGLYVGSCGGFGYLTSLSYNMKNDTAAAFDMYTTSLNIFPSAKGPVFDIGHISPLDGQQPPVGGPYQGGEAVLAHLSEGRIGGYAGGFPASALPQNADVLDKFSELRGQPMASVHVHGKKQNVLGFVYHPEFELGLPTDAAEQTGLFLRQVLQPSDNRNLPLLQLQMWQYFGKQLLRAMHAAQLPVPTVVQVPQNLRYQNPKTGVWWNMVQGKSALVPDTITNRLYV